MDLKLPFINRDKSISEIEEDTEKKEVELRNANVELTLAEKRQAILRLKEQGLKPSSFGWDWSRIKKFIKEH